MRGFSSPPSGRSGSSYLEVQKLTVCGMSVALTDFVLSCPDAKRLNLKTTNSSSIFSLFQIRILQSLNQEDFVNLIKICRQYTRHKTTFYLVFEFCELDLAGLLSNINVKFSLEIKRVIACSSSTAIRLCTGIRSP